MESQVAQDSPCVVVGFLVVFPIQALLIELFRVELFVGWYHLINCPCEALSAVCVSFPNFIGRLG